MGPDGGEENVLVVGRQFDLWWNAFWDKGDELADAIIAKNKAENKLEHMK